jgi:hypothetical protein
VFFMALSRASTHFQQTSAGIARLSGIAISVWATVAQNQ